MYASLLALVATLALSVSATPTKRDVKCFCPYDKNHAAGTNIHVWPEIQCAYPSGACTWDVGSGALLNPQQGNCPSTLTSPTACPADKNGQPGRLINHLYKYQCAYAAGACTWDGDGNLENTHQSNCAPWALCFEQ